MSVVLLVVGLILFIGLVVVHELGHFLVARRNGVVAEEFGIFFPPRLFKKKMKGGWIFSINALPLGGFVKLKGEHDTDTEPGSFGAASLWAKSKIMAAGVVMNLLTALVLFMGLAWVGMPKLVCNQFSVPSDTRTVYDSRQVSTD
ncbi:MAG TPA: site-2 protease family protein, partial [Candidatus Saccharimonadales bacterium]|nr:site-2 protease family protein [Candidatus Saccharimonadales bacterium]